MRCVTANIATQEVVEELFMLARQCLESGLEPSSVFSGQEPVIYAERRSYQHGKASYDAVDIYLRSLVSSSAVDDVLKRLSYCHVRSGRDLHPQNMAALTESGREFVLSELPLVPWMHVSRANDSYQMRLGVDTYCARVADDCGYNAGTEHSLPALTSEKLRSLYEQGELQKAGERFQSNGYRLVPSRFYRKDNGYSHPTELKRLEVVPGEAFSYMCGLLSK